MIALLFLLASSPAWSWGQDNCQSNFAFVGREVPRFRYQQNFLSENTKVEALSDKEGNVYLFRVLGNKFRRNAPGVWEERENGMVSTSLNPHIADDWSGSRTGLNDHLIIIKANLDKDGLTYWKPRPDGQFVNGKSVFQASLTRNTTLAEVGTQLYEVQLAKSKELPCLQISKENFRKVIQGMGDQPFSIEDLLERIRESGLTIPTD